MLAWAGTVTREDGDSGPMVLNHDRYAMWEHLRWSGKNGPSIGTPNWLVVRPSRFDSGTPALQMFDDPTKG